MSEFWAWFHSQDATARLILTSVASTVAGGFLFVLFPSFGADLTVAYLAYALGILTEFLLVRKDGPFVRSGMGTALRKEATFAALLAVIFAIPAFVSIAVGLPGLVDNIADLYRADGWPAFIMTGIISAVTAWQVQGLYS